MPLENRTRFNQKDLELIKHGAERVIGSVAAYNSPPFGDSNRDFVELNIYDLSDNYIQTVILKNEDWVIEDGAIKVRPGEDLRKLGYQSGEYKVEYNFFRELGGSENSVLIDEESRIYDGDFEFDSRGNLVAVDGTNKKLQLIDNKYFIHDISPDRTEIRLAPHKIQNQEYKNEFESLQSDYSYIASDPIKLIQGFDTLQFLHAAVSGSESGSYTFPEDSVNIKLNLKDGDKGFTPDMVGSDILIEDVFYFGDEKDTVINFGADIWLTNYETLSTPSGFDSYNIKHLTNYHDSTLRYDMNDFEDEDEFHDMVYYDSANHQGSDSGIAGVAFSQRAQMEGGLLHSPFIQTNTYSPSPGRDAVPGRVISNPICPGLRGAQENGVYFTTVIKSLLNVKNIKWEFTNNGRPDTGEFASESFVIEGGGPNELSNIPWESVFEHRGGFYSGLQSNSESGRNGSNPWLHEYLSSPGAASELGPSQLVGFSAPGIYDVKLSVIFQYGLTERTISVEKKRYLQIQPNYDDEDASIGMQENFIRAL
jgi:hypothetical protein